MKKILVIDDDAGMLAFLQKRLEQAGYQVHAVLNGEAGLAAIAAELPDLIIVDVIMSGLDGHSFLTEVRSAERSRHTPLIIISAKGELAELFRMENVAAFFRKPFKAEDIIAKVHELVGS